MKEITDTKRIDKLEKQIDLLQNIMIFYAIVFTAISFALGMITSNIDRIIDNMSGIVNILKDM